MSAPRATSPPRPALSLVVELQPDWSNVDRAQEAVGLLALVGHGDLALRDAVAMVSAELLENALKYALPATSVWLAIDDDRTQLVVAVTSTIRDPAHVATLEQRVRWLAGFPDAKAAYTAALELAKTPGAPCAGLGIVRIAYEGGCAVACDTSVPGLLTVRAARRRTP